MRTPTWAGLAAILAASISAASALAASPSTPASSKQSGGSGIDFTIYPPEQQPPCIMQMGGVVSWEGFTFAKASWLTPGILASVWGSDKFDFTAGNYTATVNWNYHGTGSPDENNEVNITSLVNVDFTSPDVPGAVKTTFTFFEGANVIDGQLYPFAGALPDITDITCRQ